MILVTEHFPTISFGRADYHNKFSKEIIEKVGSKDEKNIISYLNKMGIGFRRSTRGGGSTYIGPGQLVFYPIVKYEEIVNRQFGVGNYESLIDQTMMSSLKKIGINAKIFKVVEKIGESKDIDIEKAREEIKQRKDRKDVWVTEDGKNYKVGGKGIKISKGVAYHGFNFYITDKGIEGFDYINPCGYTKEELGVKSVEGILGKKIDKSRFRDLILEEIKEKFGYKFIQQVELDNLARLPVISKIFTEATAA